jgi:hypothetical protein
VLEPEHIDAGDAETINVGAFLVNDIGVELDKLTLLAVP